MNELEVECLCLHKVSIHKCKQVDCSVVVACFVYLSAFFILHFVVAYYFLLLLLIYVFIAFFKMMLLRYIFVYSLIRMKAKKPIKVGVNNKRKIRTIEGDIA